MAAVVVVALCLLLAGQAGYPLDDAWIHQDFARTLATTGQFAYLPGRTGAGSTSPLWVVLLLPPQWLFHGQPPVWLAVGWTALLGGAALAGLGLMAGLMARELARHRGAGAGAVWLAGVIASLAVVAEWHLVWAAVSGMETDLFALLVLFVFFVASRGAPPVALGLLIAVGVAVRPEAALAGLVVGLASLWGALGGLPARWTGGALARWALGWLAPFGLSAAVGCVPYLAVNLAASGHLLPSTIYAKSSYYAQGNFAQAALTDLAGVVGTLIAASPVVLLALALSYSRWLLTWNPARREKMKGGTGTTGAAQRGRDTMQQARGGATEPQGATPFSLRVALWLWVAGLITAYAGRGVATIVHGRYLMPVLPALLALAAAGAAPLLLERSRMLGIVGGALLLGAGIFSAGRGAQIYGENVRFIDGTQVATAQWLRVHAAPGSLIATHDIGAIGYFSGHQVIDMAGLADPEIIPLLGDQPALEAYLRQHHVAYVAMYTTWFPPPNALARDLARREVYNAPAAPTFVVYQTGW